MEWIKKHVDTVIVLGALASGFLWINVKFNEMEKDISTIKTVLIMQRIMPAELANRNKGEE